MVVARFVDFGLYRVMRDMVAWKDGDKKETEISAQIEKCIELTRLFGEILGQHGDYSLYSTFKKLYNEGQHVNRNFEKVLKENATCFYNRTHVFEHTMQLYLPEMKIVSQWIKDCFDNGEIVDIKDYNTEAQKVVDLYFDTPLSESVQSKASRKEIFTKSAEVIKSFFETT